jgi:hypothetical protein
LSKTIFELRIHPHAFICGKDEGESPRLKNPFDVVRLTRRRVPGKTLGFEKIRLEDCSTGFTIAKLPTVTADGFCSQKDRSRFAIVFKSPSRSPSEAKTCGVQKY